MGTGQNRWQTRPRLAVRRRIPKIPAPQISASCATARMLPDPKAWSTRSRDCTRKRLRWHACQPDNPYDGLLGTVCQQHQFNYLLWHEEDIARSPDVPDQRIAAVKRAIDRYNQQRNDWIEKIDEALIELLAAESVLPRRDARLNTETPGSAIDRLSIMALRIYHFEEQAARDDVDAIHRAQGRQSGSTAAARSTPTCRNRSPS